jgi:hypothetical protein
VREQVGEDVAALAVPVGTCLTQHLLGAWGQIGIAVDLTVRMGQSHPDLLTAVLKTEHLLALSSW